MGKTDTSSEEASVGTVEVHWMGRLGYSDALEMQEDTVAKRVSGEIEDLVYLLEHDPVYTIGRTPDQSSLREKNELPHPLVVTNRGGQGTFHGPGQLVGYPIIDLRPLGQDLHRYLRALEDAVIDLCKSFGVDAVRREGLTGAWVGERKIASIGVGVRKWVTMHGFALNVCDQLEGFEAITPCGIGGVKMTSLEGEIGSQLEVELVADKANAILQELPQRVLSTPG